MSSAIQSRPRGRTERVTCSIYDATTALLFTGGFAAVTFQDVAQRSGVGRATIYRRWSSPAALVSDAIAATAAERIVMPDTGSFRQDLEQVLQQIADFISEPLGTAALIAGLALEKELQPPQSRWVTRWADVAPIFERARTRGEIAEDCDAEAAFAQAAGSLYFRRIVMRLPIDADWINRVLD